MVKSGCQSHESSRTSPETNVHLQLSDMHAEIETFTEKKRLKSIPHVVINICKRQLIDAKLKSGMRRVPGIMYFSVHQNLMLFAVCEEIYLIIDIIICNFNDKYNIKIIIKTPNILDNNIVSKVHYITYCPSPHSRDYKQTIIVLDISVREIITCISFYRLTTQ
jgi:hypothetical protein